MEQAESNPDSLRVFTREKWFVQSGMAARGVACCSKCGTSGTIVTLGCPFAFRVLTGQPEVMPPGWQIADDRNALALSHLANFRVTRQSANSHKSGDAGERLPSDLVFTN